MTRASKGDRMTAPASTRTAVSRERPRWLLFVHQLPSTPSNLRVKAWRRMQQLGAIAVKQAVYVLPDSPAAREDFEWLKTEIEGAGGEASVFAAASVDAWSDDALIEEFRRSRQEGYVALAQELEEAIQAVDARPTPGKRTGRTEHRLAHAFRERFAAIERVDFFGSAGRDRVAALLGGLDERIANRTGTGRPSMSTRASAADPARYRGRLWVTRPRPGVDRMSSAWLIHRFIDPGARFGFVADRDAAPPDAIPFDMFGVELTHRGDHCTFETLCDLFGIDDAAVGRIATIVHDLDLKDGRFGAPEAPSVGIVIDGLQRAYADDDALLAQGMVLVEALYRAAEGAARPMGPRVVAAKRSKRGAARRRR
ncbi:MAG: chromate resistance protein ChrB domain-containing protein [Vicinamibacteraceae bacterium]